MIVYCSKVLYFNAVALFLLTDQKKMISHIKKLVKIFGQLKYLFLLYIDKPE